MPQQQDQRQQDEALVDAFSGQGFVEAVTLAPAAFNANMLCGNSMMSSSWSIILEGRVARNFSGL